MVYDHVGVTFFMNLRRRIWRVWRRRHTRRLLFCDVFGHPQIQMLWHSTYNSVAAASRRASSFRSESEIFGWSARAITFFGRRSGAIWKTPAFTEQSSRWLESEQISPTLKSYHYFKYYTCYTCSVLCVKDRNKMRRNSLYVSWAFWACFVTIFQGKKLLFF